VRTLAQLPTPNQHRVQRGQVSCVLWVTCQNDTEETLCYGTGLGYIVFWRRSKQVSVSDVREKGHPLPKPMQGLIEINAQRLGTGLEITCIAYDPLSESEIRLAVGTRGRLVQVWRMDTRTQLHAAFSVQLDKTVPKSVAFSENSEDIHVFGLYDGNV
jgi:hypothetical protein